MKLKKLKLILPALAAFTASAHAASYIGATYEGFDYPVGTVSGDNGGTGWNATGDDSLANTTSWTNIQASAAVTAGGLSYSATGYASSSGNKLTMTPNAGTTTLDSARAFRNLGQTVATDSVGSLYFSFLMQKTNVTNRALNLAFFNDTTELFNIGQNNTAPSGNLGTLGVNFGGLNYPTSSLTLGNGVHLIIGKLDFNVSGSNDSITLWVNPTDVSGGEGSLTPYLTVGGVNLTSTGLNTIRPFAGQTSDTFNAVNGNFDEIRVGSSFASVIPEPSTALLGGLGLLALLRRRRA